MYLQWLTIYSCSYGIRIDSNRLCRRYYMISFVHTVLRIHSIFFSLCLKLNFCTFYIIRQFVIWFDLWINENGNFILFVFFVLVFIFALCVAKFFILVSAHQICYIISLKNFTVPTIRTFKMTKIKKKNCLKEYCITILIL